MVGHFDGDSTVLGFVEGTAGVAVEGRQGRASTETQRHGEKFLLGTPTSSSASWPLRDDSTETPRNPVR